MSLSSSLDVYQQEVDLLVKQAKNALAAAQKLQKAVATGMLRDIEGLRTAAVKQAGTLAESATACPEFEFDTAEYLGEEGDFLPELQQAAEDAGVSLKVSEGVVFCYPVLLRREAAMAAVRIDKRLVYQLRPELLTAELKKLQSKPPRTNPARFIESLFAAYELARAERGLTDYIPVPLTALYDVLTILPGISKDFTLLDFIREIYFLDSGDLKTTRKGYNISFTNSTGTRMKAAKIYKFVTRDGLEQQYAEIKFTPPVG
ncbi:MAG: hypothetical protein WCJ56_05015 [bacterium]